MAQCKDRKRGREHFSAVLPFSVAEKIVDKPLRIRGVAMTVGMSRNHNVYTAEELAAFASKLVGAPIYLEHVYAGAAVGKVTKSEFVAPNLLYEAEVYDDQVAEQIRKGLIQHVSVGADYDLLDVVDARVPRGLHDAELSFVAVPGIPEANVQVLEHLLARGRQGDKLKVKAKELLEPLQCVFCGRPGEYIVSVCTSCGDNAALAAFESLRRLPLAEAAGDLPSSFTAFKVRFVAGPGACDDCLALAEKTFIYGTEPQPHPNCKCPGYEVVERLQVHVNFKGVESLEEKDLETLADKTAAKINEKLSVENELLKRKLSEAEEDSAEKQAQIERSQQYGIGIKDGGNVTKPEEFASIPDGDFADPVNYKYPVDAEHVQAALTYFNVPENRADYSGEEQTKILGRIVSAAVAAGIEVSYQADDAAYQALPEDVKAKLQGYEKEPSAEERLAAKDAELTVAKDALERVKKLVPGVDLLVDPPVLMPVSEALERLARLELPKMQERLSLGNQVQAQKVRKEIFEVKQKYGVA
jgi:hypothetical protein